LFSELRKLGCIYFEVHAPILPQFLLLLSKVQMIKIIDFYTLY